MHCNNECNTKCNAIRIAIIIAMLIWMEGYEFKATNEIYWNVISIAIAAGRAQSCNFWILGTPHQKKGL